MRETGKRTKQMGWELLLTSIMLNMKDTGLMTNSMDQESRHGVNLELIMQLISEIFIRERNKEKADLIGKTVLIILVTL